MASLNVIDPKDDTQETAFRNEFVRAREKTGISMPYIHRTLGELKGKYNYPCSQQWICNVGRVTGMRVPLSLTRSLTEVFKQRGYTPDRLAERALVSSGSLVTRKLPLKAQFALATLYITDLTEEDMGEVQKLADKLLKKRGINETLFEKVDNSKD